MQQQPSVLGGLLPLILIFVVFYFLLIWPQRKQRERHRRMIESLRRGDKIVTVGGIYGTVRDIKDDSFIIEIDRLEEDKPVKIRVTKSAIAAKRESVEETSESKENKE
ncbi:MAG: preprotein translocase subunit YajC [Synergistetes bacterium]|nr:preprotein translocase subunit YajC [Synergistota bacterium]MCX8127237.1 preprotein translocase subunit YajC [Synergistota bacterium]MDW8191877.1 preprotein translocase subunit YajC [Synergistota bacterium]